MDLPSFYAVIFFLDVRVSVAGAGLVVDPGPVDRFIYIYQHVFWDKRMNLSIYGIFGWHIGWHM